MLTPISEYRGYADHRRAELELRGRPNGASPASTGAGKSIVVDALGLLLGDRGGAGRGAAPAHSAPSSRPSSTWQSPAVGAWLRERDLDEPLLRRSRTGIGFASSAPTAARARASTAAPRRWTTWPSSADCWSTCRTSPEHQSLGRRDAQLAVLDHYGRHADQLGEVAALRRAAQAAQRARRAGRGACRPRGAPRPAAPVRRARRRRAGRRRARRARSRAPRYANLGRLVEGGRPRAGRRLRRRRRERLPRAVGGDRRPRAAGRDRPRAARRRSRRCAARSSRCRKAPPTCAAGSTGSSSTRRAATRSRPGWPSFTRLARKHRVGVEELAALRERLHLELATLQRSTRGSPSSTRRSARRSASSRRWRSPCATAAAAPPPRSARSCPPRCASSEQCYDLLRFSYICLPG